MATTEELKEVFVTGAIPTEANFHDLIDGVKGDKGDTGSAGKDGTNGAKGDTGTPGTAGTNGKDGFGTEAQYDAIIARLDALEAVE